MYICICNGFTDRQIRVAARQGLVRSVSTMYRHLGCEAQCGRCSPTVLKIMREPVVDAGLPHAGPSPAAANTDVANPEPAAGCFVEAAE